MLGFQVPFALDARERLVAPGDAAPRARYACPECRGVVDLHAGAKKQRHFHHRPGASACGVESASHAIAKRLVVQAVSDWRDAGAAPPVFERACAAAGCGATCRQAMPAKVKRAVEERALRSGRVVDVALLGPGDIVVCALEIVHTHEVDADKARALEVPWAEVRAADVCASAGRVLAPVQDRLLPWLCEAHAPERRARARGAREDKALYARLLRELSFRLDEYPGFEIEGIGSCVRGHDGLVFAWSGKEPPWPRPPLVVATHADVDWTFDAARGGMRALLPFRKRYVSACPACGEPLVLGGGGGRCARRGCASRRNGSR